MPQVPTDREYDLEARTFAFAQAVRVLVRRLPRTISNAEDVRQLIRASGSVGANYIEATEGLGKKDFKMHIRIARKEAKEAQYFVRLLDTRDDPITDASRATLVDEAQQLVRIFSAIIRNMKD